MDNKKSCKKCGLYLPLGKEGICLICYLGGEEDDDGK